MFRDQQFTWKIVCSHMKRISSKSFKFLRYLRSVDDLWILWNDNRKNSKLKEKFLTIMSVLKICEHYFWHWEIIFCFDNEESLPSRNNFHLHVVLSMNQCCMWPQTVFARKKHFLSQSRVFKTWIFYLLIR